ncbi:VirK family antimicrobial peptide resistance protein [Campylobacter sp. VicNov18]|uniref:VirK family antimicrobial peptide resistance protein n=1 Tax=Campylobacter bilis TaxID=2691918 RepID=UPI001322AEC0|nr:VirK family antimicrobial peptide resistance protein [Campylobacter bilis]MPV63685.1 VirK family antimicrobial peptide resistance protein [Campylobacter hepaticus]MBM0637186.1 VirK family antimicrobial peptide resistance protein [Campylobacter bilis]MCC8277903.1 VirK family antimicrobial peptide resistance protein [Campylobacter bilis]MCC8298834.1 VirK family antimicrobial peptide resistance protein [Campylobacter bilis]MCC8300813.1 VirK family antimicrobial peptide resistance protein [Camp
MSKKFHYPTPNFHDEKKSIIFWRYMRFQARKFLHFPQVKFLEKTLNHENNRHLRDFFTARPYACYNVIRRFCDKSFGAKKRVQTLIHDVNQGLLHFQFLPEDRLIFSFDEDFKLFLGYNRHAFEEGFWAFSLRYKGQIITQCNFCFTLENNLLLSCIQGYQYKDFDVLKSNKILTKKCHGLRPIALLIECAKMLCKILKLHATLGVHEKNQIRSQKGEDKGYFVNYKKIWLENGGEFITINKQKYYKLSHTQKNLEAIPSNKRSMYKKRFSMLEEIKCNLKQILSI